ncbi:hypothetical protein [Mucilaginibacter celer]|uniref:Uncharacterized protein n=1 Tax=Mucilaginibacter celer TaxID=2305508 RepID=A0A494VKS6_9SPHI|nr:hypothetical protein [Mucilaginibacter celer]AYL95777.1 hypothetical protein HYN43_010960 [Mucilaginibacter celer]
MENVNPQPTQTDTPDVAGSTGINEISPRGKFLAGFLLIIFIIAAGTTIVAYWPDKLPPAGKPARYQYKAFNITLLDSCQLNSG